MSKKNHSPGPVPPGNRPAAGPGFTPGQDEDAPQAGDTDTGEAFQEQDPKRRLGGYGTAGEHPIQQPSNRNDGGTHNK